MDMLYTEWNWDDALAVQREEGWEEGREEGLEEGLEKGREEGLGKGKNSIL
jgi:flagellar biosynthesis/type III secretory pathway protein FliH